MMVLRRFLWLALLVWLPFIAGLALILPTGQIDFWMWVLPCAVAVVASAMIAPSDMVVSRVLWTAAGCFLTVGFYLLSSGLPTASDMAILAAMIAVSAIAATGLRCQRLRFAGLAMLTGIIAAPWLLHQDAQIEAIVDRQPLAVVTALPLFWSEAATSPAMQSEAPIITVLRTRFDVRPIDDVHAATLTPFNRLLLAQPRALAPQALVAIDMWVRAGGHIVILADPLLRWPSDLPLGDRRRAPLTSLLDPLLTHWGLTLEPSTGPAAGQERHRLVAGRLLALAGSSRFSTTNGRCEEWPAESAMHCTVGKGTALLIADADLLDDMLWLADPAEPLNMRQWTADNPQLLVKWLGGTLRGKRYWVDHESDALRWALILGTIWALLGTLLLARAGQRVEQLCAPEQSMKIWWKRRRKSVRPIF